MALVPPVTSVLCKTRTTDEGARRSSSAHQAVPSVSTRPRMSASGAKQTSFGQREISANDPKQTLAVRCDNGFKAGFRPYQSARLERYDAVS